jgi:4-alpha-glucanotransferase
MMQADKSETAVRTNAYGIDLNYEDALGRWHDVPETTVRAILLAMDGSLDEEESGSNRVVVLKQGEGYLAPCGGRILLENGGDLRTGKSLPRDLPLGYHSLELDDAVSASRLIVAPPRCYLPDNLSVWGWAVQLYAARSRESWGIGDLADLEKLARWSGAMGAGMLLVNPLSAASPTNAQQESPYYPTSRRFFNPLWLHVEAVPGVERLQDLERYANAGRELNQKRLIDRNSIFKLKMAALEHLWSSFEENTPDFLAFCRDQGTDLERFATFCVLAEKFQQGWPAWPKQYQHPGNREVAEFAAAHQARVGFHKWLQWLIDRQLSTCASHLSLMQDLPIGVDPEGADAWAWQDVYARGMSVGAPPDEFNTQGQNWGLPPFNPHKLRNSGYEAFIQTIRAAFRNSGGLRIDHVMGLFRLFWIPQGASARNGAYVRYPADDLLSIVALESERAKAYVVGEDLGTVEKDVRRKLDDAKILSYRLLWFEKEDPSTYPHNALAAITTHDLPTVAGLWTGSDLLKQQELGLNPNEEGTDEIRVRLAKITGLDTGCAPEKVIGKSYEVLASAPCRIITAALDDAAAVEERPNVPTTMADKNPNWSLALPVELETIMASPLAGQISTALKRSAKPTAKTLPD